MKTDSLYLLNRDTNTWIYCGEDSLRRATGRKILSALDVVAGAVFRFARCFTSIGRAGRAERFFYRYVGLPLVCAVGGCDLGGLLARKRGTK